MVRRGEHGVCAGRTERVGGSTQDQVDGALA
jgi:hypothetical protein